MSAFKEQIEADVSNIFLCTDEFADIHNVNGQDMPVMIDSVSAQEREKRFSEHMDGSYEQALVLCIAVADLRRLPESGSMLRLDGRPLRVLASREDQGMFVLTVTQNMARRGAPR